MDLTDTIALIKVAPTKLNAICATSSFTIRHNSKTVVVRKNEMISMKENSLEKVPLSYDAFHLVLNKKHDVDLDKVHEESDMEDPTDLES